MPNSALIKQIQKIRTPSILVVGDVMLDEYHWCQVTRLSPEAPVPVCRVTHTSLMPGGAANVATNILTLGGTPHLLGLAGDDSSAEKLCAKLAGLGVSTDSILIEPSRPTTLKSRIVAQHQHVVRVDREDPTWISAQTEDRLLKAAQKLVKTCSAILISDYLKGVITPTLAQKLMDLGRTHKIPVIVDPKGDDYRKYERASLLTPNFSEFQAVGKQMFLTESQIKTFGLKLIQDLELGALIITRSEKGMTLMTRGGDKIDIPTQAREVSDITGAGDTVISALTIGIASHMPIETAAAFANFAAGVSVGKIGTSTVTLTEVIQAIKNDTA